MNRLRQSIVIAVAFVLCAAVVASAAQAGPGGPGGPGGMRMGAFPGGMGTVNKMTLIGVEKVQTELKIAADQKEKITEITKAFSAAQRELFTGMRGGQDMTPEERTKAREEMQKKRDALVKETEKKLDAALKAEQVTRLNEITLQQQGVEGMISERIVAALKVTEDQVKKIKAVIADRDKELGTLMGGRRGPGEQGGDQAGGTREERQKKMDDIRKKAGTTALAVFTKEQQEGYTKHKGKAFELTREELMRGTGFGGQGGGGRRGGGAGGGGQGGGAGGAGGST
jgi:hypothetical protein